jgi:membrane protein YqaA with SNARE-associated domain
MTQHRLADAAAALWAFAEATLFFVVPDVFLSFRTLHAGWHQGGRACVLALSGAVAGGVVMLFWSRSDPQDVAALLEALPAISPAMLVDVDRSMAGAGWPLAMVLGSVTGIPYKLYAAAAGTHGIAPLTFAAVTLLARSIRFFAVVTLVALLRKPLQARFGARRTWIGLTGFWVTFYGLFWALMPG